MIVFSLCTTFRFNKILEKKYGAKFPWYTTTFQWINLNTMYFIFLLFVMGFLYFDCYIKD